MFVNSSRSFPFDVLRQLLETKAIGQIKSLYTDYGEYFTSDHRIFDPKLAGGPLLDLGTYLFRS